MVKREDIIQAIKKAAQDNGGIPLGVRAFERETGIKQSEWKSVYWVRWGEALKEAGLEPNTFNKREDTSILLEKLIPVIRHFGKLPTVAEIRFYSRAHQKIPNDKTIHNHFPTRYDLVDALLKFTSSRAQYQDIFLMCQKINLPVTDTSTTKNGQEGYVYLFKSGNHYKVGNSYNIEQRVKQIKTQMPDSLTIFIPLKQMILAGLKHRQGDKI